MAKYLAIFNTTINDIELHGFVTMTDKEQEHYEELASSITWDFSYDIGTDKIDFTCGDDLLSCIDFKEITNEEFKLIKRVFTDTFGTFITEDYLDDIIGEEIGSEFEEDFDDEEDKRYKDLDEDDLDD
jgi:hypothetical protein